MNKKTIIKGMTIADVILELIGVTLTNSGLSHRLLLVKLVRIIIHSAKIRTRK